MIRNAGYAMEQFCQTCREKGYAFNDCWWPYDREFWGYREADENSVTVLRKQCLACQLERMRETRMRKAA